MEQRFFVCETCGNIIAMVKPSGVPVMCCGKKMKEIVPNTTDAAQEKHVPVWTKEGNLVKVQVGSVAHPMIPAHYIEWVSLQTKAGNQRKALSPEQAPEVTFALTDGDEVEAVYAYCNLHGLWKA
ncbi:MAG: desulfoferrodoxin [Clostridia bacterium]|nr:desulfoferrodoxin [Clostridia bacterium]